MKGNRTIKSWIAYGLAPLLLIVFGISVYREVRSQSDLPQAWQYIQQSLSSKSIGWFLVAFVGVWVNWGLEASKWKLLLRHTETVSFGKAFKGVLTGVSFTLFTPNRIGEYLGRIWHLDEKNRGAAVSLSIAGSIAQLFVTCVFGMIATEWLWQGSLEIPFLPHNGIALLTLEIIGWGVTLLFLLIYFNVGEIGQFLSRITWLRAVHSGLIVLDRFSKQDLLVVLIVSLLRYLVFLLQYYFLFQFFGVELSLDLSFLCVAMIFLFLALIPGMALAELGLRGKLSLWIVGAFSANSLAIVMAVTAIWFLNLILPAVVGAAFLSKSKLRR